MNKTEAYNKMREGYKITHELFSSEEYLYMNNKGIICT